MELSKSAKEILTQAQMFRMDSKGDELCVEHLLYGILVMAKENSADGRSVKDIVSREMMNPEDAMIQLKKDANEDGSAEGFRGGRRKRRPGRTRSGGAPARRDPGSA